MSRITHSDHIEIFKYKGNHFEGDMPGLIMETADLLRTHGVPPDLKITFTEDSDSVSFHLWTGVDLG